MGQGVTPVDPSDLLKKLEAQLQLSGVPAGSNLVGAGMKDLAFLTVWPDDVLLRNPPGNRFVAVRPSRFPIWQTIIQGAGSPVSGYLGQKTMTGFDPVVSLVLFSQNNADPENKSKQAVTEDVIGFMAFALKVFSAVQFWNPFLAADPTAKLLREPARVSDGGIGINARTAKDAWWTVGVMDLALRFTAKFPDNMGEGS